MPYTTRPPTGPSPAPPGQSPPLIIQPHPGPTSDARIRLELRTQFFTNRGFAVVDVDYRGSTGYGRAFRTQLDGRWGILDVCDCVDVAAFLIERGDADPGRTVISGASAGGFTALRALATTDRFAAGVSWFGITDLAAFRAYVPRFQRHHTDRLVGPWPDAAPTYQERSPLHHADRITRPVLVIQGRCDDVVAPEQADRLIRALRGHGAPVAELTFPDEGHGFRHAGNLQRALEAELTFYLQGGP
ncbi:MAG: prolyl oligopeptidase family serine peptidase [Actinomycetota bacterium]|nr:prolyl oligopeptidase family serine peptidase [Actinomycetota bacterium]